MFKIKGSGTNLRIKEVDEIQGNKRAKIFLNKVDHRLSQQGLILTLKQATDIGESVRKVKKSASERSPKLYKFQAKYNPFSQPWKIERLYWNVLNITDQIEKTYKDNAEQNINDPFNFFSVSPVIVNNLEKVLFVNPKASNDVRYIYFSIFDKKIFFKEEEMEEYRGQSLAVPVVVDEENNCIRIMKKLENAPVGNSVLSFSHDLITLHAQEIMDLLKNP